MRGWQEQLLPAAGLNLYGLRGAPLSWRMLLAGAQDFIVCLDHALQRVLDSTTVVTACT